MKEAIDISQYDLLTPITARGPIHIVKAQGAGYTDDQGRGYIDLNEMCQVLGQNNSAYIQAMTSALQGVTTNKAGFGGKKAELYEHFLKTTKGDFRSIHLTTSGSEAVEWAVRLAKRMTGRSETISFWNSIHGRTYLCASMSGLPRRKAGYGPLATGVILVPYPRCAHCPAKGRCGGGCFPCLEFVSQQYLYGSAQDAAAVVVEPYQGACIDIPPQGYMEALYRWAKEREMLFIMDEVQAGMGRGGELYNYQRCDFKPDMLLLGKALGNGMHISALLLREQPPAEFLPAVSGGVGDETLACASACQVFEQLENGLLDHVREVGKLLGERLDELRQYEAVADVRSIGLAAAVEFHRDGDCTKVYNDLDKNGFFVGHVANCITCKPPFVITAEQIAAFAAALEDSVKSL